MRIRIIIADDHKMVREGLRSLLEKQPDMEVIGEAENGRTMLKLVQDMSPNMIIMDVAMPDLNGIEATQKVMAKMPSVKVLALSMYSDKRFVAGMLRAGALGYLLKDCAFDELVRAVHTVIAGQIYLSPAIAEIVVKNYIHRLEKTNSSAFSVLTTREREVLQLLAEGNSAKEIAYHLNLSVKTVETYRHQIIDKLRVHSIAELTKYAIRQGLTPLDK